MKGKTKTVNSRLTPFFPFFPFFSGGDQPASLANGDPVFAVIAYNEQAVQTQTGLGAMRLLGSSGLNQRVAPASLFIHEASENLAFRAQGNWDYQRAHWVAIGRELLIRADLHIGGGFAGAWVTTTIPRKGKN